MVGTAMAGCSCPNFVHSTGNGMAIMNDGREVVLPPCCEDLATQKQSIKDHGLLFKHTPGSPCESLTSCGSCTTLAFCRWHEGLPGSGGNQGLNVCVDETDVHEETAMEYVSSCASRAGLLYGLAEERDLKEWKETGNWSLPTVNTEARLTLTETPILAEDETQWPHKFDDYLPPAGCDKVDKSKYPTGMPGCGDYINEGTSYHSGHMTTDIVSDPRLPVETHVSKYPLGANSNLPDHLVEGGDWSLPQPNAPWIKPDFNKNGCLGGPCDEMSQHACTGLACSHNVIEGEKHHDDTKGSVYKRENGGEHLKKEDHASKQ